MKKRSIAIILSILLLIPVIASSVSAADFNARVNSSESSINFRTSPSTSSSVIAQIPDGTLLHVTSLAYSAADDLIFGQTDYNGSQGWISLRQTAISDFTGFDTTVKSSEGSINFRTSASTGSSVITGIPNGTSLYISDLSYNSADDLFFGLCEYQGMTGWISLRQTTLDSSAGPSTPASGTASTPAPGAGPQSGSSVPAQGGLSVRTDVGFNGVVQVMAEEGSVNFRSEPSTASGVLGMIANHEALTIYDIVRNEDLVWGYTEYNGIYGWVSLRNTATPFHEYGMPEEIRDWDGTAPSGQTNGSPDAAQEAVYRYYNNEENREYTIVQDVDNHFVSDYPEAQIRFTSYDVGQPGDYLDVREWPHYAVIEHYDEKGEVLWSVTTDRVYRLNGGVAPIGASPDMFFYTDYDQIYAIGIADGAPVWTVPNQIGGKDGGFKGKAVGNAGEVYICAAGSGKCMVISSRGEVVHSDADISPIGANLIFTDIRYSGDNMISVTAQSQDGKINQFMISRDDL